ncbi:hypothetical protein R6U77_02925 [Lysinibacillus louembei]|uniref:Uncharacterized protein n=1 Tax=Lysinibacillus louembei TaxID=1470088 RepID=A0ABZ0RYX4_9BACI|nr:hypothetical protein [Lysinibacillus louembei]WPK12670.1 hypothetical protein R6U77_02925 [Lysinibacillus louembei]
MNYHLVNSILKQDYSNLFLEQIKELDYLKEISNISLNKHTITIDRKDPFLVEKEIELYGNKIRMAIIEQVQSKISKYYKSPIIDKEAFEAKILFNYERSYSNDNLAKMAWADILESSEVLLFSSGMATISTILTSITSIFNNKCNCVILGKYFETLTISNLLQKIGVNISQKIEENHVYNILFLEPTKYSWKLENQDIEQIKNQLLSKDIQFVIIDSTLSQDSRFANEIVTFINDGKLQNKYVIEIKSRLKLYQLGFEFCNLGSAEIYATAHNDIKSISEYISKIRTVLGTTPDFFSLSMLEHPILNSQGLTEKYINTIFSNNKILRNYGKSSINTNFITKISNKITGKPFTIIEIGDKKINNYAPIIDHLRLIQKEYLPCLFLGSSFGFRHHRYEMIIPDNRIDEAYLKFCPGYRKGPSFDLFCNYFSWLSQISSIEEFSNNTGIQSKFDTKQFD